VDNGFDLRCNIFRKCGLNEKINPSTF